MEHLAASERLRVLAFIVLVLLVFCAIGFGLFALYLMNSISSLGRFETAARELLTQAAWMYAGLGVGTLVSAFVSSASLNWMASTHDALWSINANLERQQRAAPKAPSVAPTYTTVRRDSNDAQPFKWRAFDD